MKKKAAAEDDEDLSSALREAGGLKGLWETAINAVIRPPRSQYELEQLGPAHFTRGGRDWERVDFELRVRVESAGEGERSFSLFADGRRSARTREGSRCNARGTA